MKESERVQMGSKDTEVKRDMEFKEPFNQTASSLCSPTSSFSPSSSLKPVGVCVGSIVRERVQPNVDKGTDKVIKWT